MEIHLGSRRRVWRASEESSEPRGGLQNRLRWPTTNFPHRSPLDRGWLTPAGRWLWPTPHRCTKIRHETMMASRRHGSGSEADPGMLVHMLCMRVDVNGPGDGPQHAGPCLADRPRKSSATCCDARPTCGRCNCGAWPGPVLASEKSSLMQVSMDQDTSAGAECSRPRHHRRGRGPLPGSTPVCPCARTARSRSCGSPCGCQTGQNILNP